MNSRLIVICVALLVLVGASTWVLKKRPAIAPAVAMAVAPARAAVPTVAAIANPTAGQAIAPSTAPAVVAQDAPATPQVKSSPLVHVNASGELNYTARPGDTVSQLAIALLGSDSKEHRDVVIAANPSLQSDPDRVLAGHTYSLDPSSDDAPAKAARTSVVANPKKAATNVKVATDNKPAVVAGPKLAYTAQPGDTVRVLATNLLGGDTKANRDTIIAQNPSLQQDPDHLVAGQTYRIVAPQGLAADPNPPKIEQPTVQLDADEIVRQANGRSLRDTARPGDTVSKLAVALMGSDSPANRDLIIKNNPSLKENPDNLTAGQTYWIAAPAADASSADANQ